jgi:tRNA dimethylallyltransferase
MELQNLLRIEDLDRARSMNNSDWNNARRLVRAIELAQVRPSTKVRTGSEGMDYLWIGITAPFPILEQNIKRRIDRRLKSGVLDEVSKEIAYGKKPTISRTVLGFEPLSAHLQGKISREEAMLLWFQKERQYAKRQLTWFSKEKRILWFDISSESWKDDVTAYVGQWYTKRQRYADQG